MLSFPLGELIDGLKGFIRRWKLPLGKKRLSIGDRAFTAYRLLTWKKVGSTVTCKEIPAAISQGRLIQEALDNLTDAVELCLEAEAELRKCSVQAQ